jgi:hypothetical protein
MRHATGLAILALAGAAAGCCTPRWPTTASLPPAQRAVRYVAQAVKEADRRCAEDSETKAEAEACIEVYGVLKTALIKLEDGK